MEQYPHVPWTDIISLRNRIVHGYSGLDMEKVKPLIEKELADLLGNVRSIIASIDLVNGK